MTQEMQIAAAQEHFGALIATELERIAHMKESQETLDFSKLDTIVVGILPGDGVGPLLMVQALRVLKKLLEPELANGKIELRTIEGMTIENRAALEESLPQSVLDACRQCHVLIKGPFVTPRPGDPWPNLPSANSLLRRNLELFAAVRPIRIRVQTLPGSQRIARAAFDYARKNGRKNVTVVTKANIVKRTDGNFLNTVRQVGAEEYPEIQVQERLVDAMAAKMTDPEFTAGCEVFVLPNLYGDIVTDVAAELQGGIGSACSSNIGTRYALFEAIHGTAPYLMSHGRGAYADPCSLIRAVGQLMAHIGYGDRSERLERALDICTRTERKLIITTDKDGATSEAFTDYLLETLEQLDY